ncbi:hypothetical protein B4080_3119 [Bacillus cereus]|nr:hypothetical protein [Bacillus cereus]KLA27047.1 hypothetical protein B4080_3119 [Bacillus cereus]
MKENGVSTLRFTFEGAGCCGPSYGINLEEAKEIRSSINIKPEMKQVLKRLYV